MRLAKSSNGVIGRQTRSMGELAVVDQPSQGDRRGNVYLSSRSIEEDEAFWKNKENQARAAAQAKAIRAAYEKRAESLRHQDRQRQIKGVQSLKGEDKTQAALKTYFAKQMGRSETENTIRRLKADFNQNESIPTNVPKRTMIARADYRQNYIVGNPLTRDGVFGPVTDYDQIVQGNPYGNIEPQVAGETMVRKPRSSQQQRDAMGMGDFWDDLSTSFQTEVTTQAPAALVSALLPKPPTTGTSTTYNVQQPATYVARQAPDVIAGIPNWALYTGIGLVGVGVLFMAIKAMK